MLQEKVIIGIDPGTLVMGYGVIHVLGNKIKALQYGVLELGQYADHARKLQEIFIQTTQLIDDFSPNVAALEAPFLGKNIQAMLKLGRVQGVVMAAALAREVAIVEYAPRKIKQSVTGNGHASKEQVAKMVMRLLSLGEVPKQLDATDALATAICHAYQYDTQRKLPTTWKDMLRVNPKILCTTRIK